MRESLTILAAGQRLGQVTRRGDRLWFRYESAWQESSDAFQLSVSMPLANGGHPHGRSGG